MPLLQPGSRSPRWQARNARAQVAVVEEQVAGVGEAITTINETVETVNEQVGVVTQAASDAMTAADTARGAADEAKSQVGLVFTFQQVRDSYSDDGVLTGAADGGGKINVAAHERHYLNTTVAIPLNAGMIDGLAFSTTYQVFYDDPTFEGGAVAYQASPTIEGALASLEHPARHFVGEVKTPASGGTATEGGGGAGRPYWKPGLQENVQIE